MSLIRIEGEAGAEPHQGPKGLTGDQRIQKLGLVISGKEHKPEKVP